MFPVHVVQCKVTGDAKSGENAGFENSQYKNNFCLLHGGLSHSLCNLCGFFHRNLVFRNRNVLRVSKEDIRKGGPYL